MVCESPGPGGSRRLEKDQFQLGRANHSVPARIRKRHENSLNPEQTVVFVINILSSGNRSEVVLTHPPCLLGLIGTHWGSKAIKWYSGRKAQNPVWYSRHRLSRAQRAHGVSIRGMRAPLLLLTSISAFLVKAASTF